MQIKDIIHAQPFLTHDIDRAIKNAVDDVFKKSANPQEPDFVASLVVNFTTDLYHILRKHFPGNKFGVTGVFTHQKPVVDIGLGKNPELGDLLLVYIHQDTSGKKVLNSMLLQAKVSATQSTRVPLSDLHQLELYEKWPDFTYKRAGHLKGVSRKISPKSVTDGAQYLLIDNTPIPVVPTAAFFPMGTATPNRQLVLNDNLATELVDFLKLKSGRTFDEDPGKSTDEWSQMIWDLLEITKTQTRRTNYNGLFDRQNVQGVFVQMLSTAGGKPSFLGAGFGQGGDGGKTDGLAFANDNGNGIPLVLIESIDQEAEGQ